MEFSLLSLREEKPQARHQPFAVQFARRSGGDELSQDGAKTSEGERSTAKRNGQQGQGAGTAGDWTFDRFLFWRGMRMKALCNRDGLLSAFGMVSGVAPARSPKPILQNIKLIADPDEGSVLMATDLEVGIRHRVLGMKVEQPSSAILPTQRMTSILRTSDDQELWVEGEEDHLIVRGRRSEFKLPSEDPSGYPEVPDFAATSYHVVAAADLRKLIRRTIFATDVESTRYALGGVLVELTGDSITMVGTDGRRLARMMATAETENEAPTPTGNPVIPVKRAQADRTQPRRRRSAGPPRHPVGERGAGPDRAGCHLQPPGRRTVPSLPGRLPEQHRGQDPLPRDRRAPPGGRAGLDRHERRESGGRLPVRLGPTQAHQPGGRRGELAR